LERRQVPAVEQPIEAAEKKETTIAEPSDTAEESGDTATAKLGAIGGGDQSSICRDATKEFEKASKQSTNSDRLFRYRKALRMCPENANFHVGLAKFYHQVFDRTGDAAYEYHEALKLDPNNQEALAGLREIGDQQ
jgi:cytochrome c-type biogenesis protein CcmH/NrfG